MKFVCHTAGLVIMPGDEKESAVYNFHFRFQISQCKCSIFSAALNLDYAAAAT